MRTIYFDCTGGVSGDMVLRALEELGGHAHAHGRSYTEVKNIIDSAQEYAQRIYSCLLYTSAAYWRFRPDIGCGRLRHTA